MQRKLLSKATVTFDVAYKTAIAMEAASNESKVFYGNDGDASAVDSLETGSLDCAMSYVFYVVTIMSHKTASLKRGLFFLWQKGTYVIRLGYENLRAS